MRARDEKISSNSAHKFISVSERLHCISGASSVGACEGGVFFRGRCPMFQYLNMSFTGNVSIEFRGSTDLHLYHRSSPAPQWIISYAVAQMSAMGIACIGKEN